MLSRLTNQLFAVHTAPMELRGRTRSRWMISGFVAGLALLGVSVPVQATAQMTYTVLTHDMVARVSPTHQPTGESRVSLTVVDSTVGYTVQEIARQAKLRVIYNRSDAAFSHRITLRIADQGVLAAMATTLRGTGLEARMAPDGEAVMIGAAAERGERSRAAGGTITGRVTDSASGAGLGGVSVKVLGTKLAAVTSDSGRFSLHDVPAGEQVLSVKLFGYKPVERTVTVADSGMATVRIFLVSVPTVLSGVVTTASGVQRKVQVGNDITTLNVDSIRRIAPITSVTDLLETRVPGLTVEHSSGTPGDPSRIRIRGASSIIESNDPVVVVDGIRVYAAQSDPRNNNLAKSAANKNVLSFNGSGSYVTAYAAPSPLDQIDPSNIETIEVLKGPSATAIYGSDAANGVIVITTKHGRAGPTHWDLSIGRGVNWLPGSWPLNYHRFGSDIYGLANVYNSSGNLTTYLSQAAASGTIAYNTILLGQCAWYTINCQTDSVVAFQALNDPRFTVFSHGSDQQANLSVSGGVSTVTYSMTGSGTTQLGYLRMPGHDVQLYDSLYGPTPNYLRRPDNYTTYGVSGQLTAQPSRGLRVTVQSSLLHAIQQRSSLAQAVPELQGNYYSPQLIAGQMLVFNDVEKATDNQMTYTDALTLLWQPRPWLPITATGGINTIQRTDETYVPFGVNMGYIGITAETDTLGSFGLGRGTSQDNTLNVGTTIPLWHQFLMLGLGGQAVQENTADISSYSNQLAPGVSDPGTFLIQKCMDATYTGNRADCGGQNTQEQISGTSTYGWYVEPRLNFQSKFFVSPGFRLDGGSGGSHFNYSSSSGGFAAGGLTAFPKIDLSWVAVDRQGSRPMGGLLTLLRPRIAFGYAGTQPGLDAKLRLYNIGQAYNTPTPGIKTLNEYSYLCPPLVVLDGGSTPVPEVCLNGIGNTNLRPERSEELEAGADMTLWNGRLTLTYSQYDKTRFDAIMAIPIAPSVVAINGDQTLQQKNIGTIRNTGAEVTFNAIILQSRALSWNVSANLSTDNNKVLRLNSGQGPITFADGTRIVAGFPLFGEWQQPLAFFADANHNGIIEPSEIRVGDSAVYVGQPAPKYQLNFNSGVTVLNGHLGINANFAYQNGMLQNNYGALLSGTLLELGNNPNAPLATQAALIAAACALGGGGGGVFGIGNCERGTAIGIMQNVNTFRFNSLSINYELPQTASRWFRMPRISMALQGSNLGLLSNYRGKDPGVNAFATVSAGDQTIDQGQIPQPRTWWLKVNLGN